MKTVTMPCCLIVTAIGIATPTLADESCDKLVAALPQLKLSAATELAVSTIPDKTYKQLFDECDGDGEVNKAHKDTFAGLPLPDKNYCSTNKNTVEFVKLFRGKSGKTLVFRAKAAVDVDGSPASHGGNPNDQTKTSLQFDKGSIDETANAEEVPFVVIPQPSYVDLKKKHRFYNTFFGYDSKVRIGDLAIAIHGKYCSFGVVGDEGPEFRLGEASVRTHADLHNPQCAVANEHPCSQIKNNGDGDGIGNAVTYIIFPGSRPKMLISQTVVEVAGKEGRDRVSKFLAEFAKSP